MSNNEKKCKCKNCSEMHGKDDHKKSDEKSSKCGK
jgi:hypothetical protein